MVYSRNEYPFDLFDKDFLSFFEKPFQVKVRVYILRCLNLAAQSQNIDTRHMMAGMTAFCEANPYPEIIVGERGSDSTLIKYVNDAEKAVKNTLSPDFYRMHELDALLPKDWKLTINIKDRGMVDTLIGSVEIDLEDRFVGEAILKERISYMVFREIYTQALVPLKFAYDAESERKKNDYQSRINHLGQMIDSFDRDKYEVPVEYCELKKPGAL